MELFLDGISEQIRVNAEKLIITRKRLFSLVMSGFKGSKIIPLSAITNVKVKKATYLLSGSLELTSIKNGKNVKDIIKFKAVENETAEQITVFVQRLNAGQKFHGKIQFDCVAETLKYKQLRHAELITPEEFNYLEQLISKIEKQL